MVLVRCWISHNFQSLFQPQVTSNSHNIWCVGCLHLTGLLLLSHLQAETFHEGLNESLGSWTVVQACTDVSVAIATCVWVLSITDCMSPQSGSSHSGEFICTLALSRPSCMRIVMSEIFSCSGMRRAEHMGNIRADVGEQLAFFWFPTFCTPAERERFSCPPSEVRVTWWNLSFWGTFAPCVLFITLT